MKLLILIVVGLAALAPAAAAQTVPIGGDVPPTMELALGDAPSGTFSAFGKRGTYAGSIKVAITSSEPSAALTVADGDVVSGPRLGHLAAGRRMLPQPLEASVRGPFASLDTPVAPLLARWTRVLAREPATIRLRQTVASKRAGTYRKVLLVTLSSATP